MPNPNRVPIRHQVDWMFSTDFGLRVVCRTQIVCRFGISMAVAAYPRAAYPRTFGEVATAGPVHQTHDSDSLSLFWTSWSSQGRAGPTGRAGAVVAVAFHVTTTAGCSTLDARRSTSTFGARPSTLPTRRSSHLVLRRRSMFDATRLSSSLLPLTPLDV